MEVLARGRFDAEQPGPELRDVQVDLEDSLLRPAHLEQHGEVRLEPLADEAAALPQKQILRDLLRDRGRAAQAIAVAIIRQRLVERHEVDAVMLDESLILGRHDGARGAPGDLVATDPPVIDVADAPGLQQHHGRRRRVDPAEQEHDAER